MSSQVSDYVNFDVSSIVFSKEVKKEIPNKTGTGPGIRFFRIPISVRRKDGSLGKLIFAPSDLVFLLTRMTRVLLQAIPFL